MPDWDTGYGSKSRAREGQRQVASDESTARAPRPVYHSWPPRSAPDTPPLRISAEVRRRMNENYSLAAASARNPSSGPRRLESTPVAVHLLPLGEGRRNQALPRPRQESFPSPPGRGWLAAGAFTSRGETGEGSLPRLLRRQPHCLHHYAHELVRVLQHHRIGNPQQSYAQRPQIILFRGVFAHPIDLRVNAAIEFNG